MLALLTVSTGLSIMVLARRLVRVLPHLTMGPGDGHALAGLVAVLTALLVLHFPA